MAIIQSIYNPTTQCWNPLDPKNWEGGVVPGKEDVARFKRMQSVYSSYENNIYLGAQNKHNSNAYDGELLLPIHFNHPNYSYSSSKWNIIQRQFPGIVNDIPGGTNAQSAYAYGASGTESYFRGAYNNVNGNSTYGTTHSYNATSENQWNWLYRDTFNVNNADRLPNRYFMYASTYYLYYNGVNDTSFTIDGVTIAEPLGLVGETYFTRSRAFGQSKSDWLAENPGFYPMTDRIVDLFTGSALHVSNGGRWEIRGPHNARGLTSNNNAYLNNLNCFTVFTTTGSEYRNSNHTSGPSFGYVNAASYNMTRTDTSGYLRAAHAYGFVTGGFSGSGDTLRNMEYPIWFPEGTASIKYGTPYTSSNNGYYSKFTSGSGHIYAYTANMFYQGLGPGNHQIVKINLSDPQQNYLRGININTDYSLYTTESVIHVPLYAPLTGSNTYKVNGPMWRTSNTFYSDTLMQQWELTGSQHWEVGRIEMGGLTHFHVKDQSKITIHDLEDSTYYPSIDMYDYAVRSTLLVTDQATIHLSSSRTSLVPNYESGIYQRQNSTSVIISGSANYSSSILTEAASAGDTTIRITDAQNTFGVGDYISLESTGSIKIHAKNTDFGLDYIDGNDPNTWWSASSDQFANRHASPQFNIINRLRTDAVGGYTSTDGKYYIERSYDHAFETDEIVQIMSMSGDYITVGKMYGKEGEIQSNMGLYTHNDFTETFKEAPDSNYIGSKRVVLVDSTHLNFQTGDKLVISGSAYNVLHATTYLSQSHFYEFTSSNQPALNQVFDLLENDYSASSIWPTNSSTYGITQPSTYFTELFMKDRLLITGSYRGSRHFPDSASFNSNAYNALNYAQKSGSNQGYRSLQLDPTQAYTWYNVHPSYRMDRTNGNVSVTYRYHSIYTTNYISGEYQLKDTSNFQRGEIIVSGSLLRNGLYDPTSSQAMYTSTFFGVVNGCIPFSPPSRKDSYGSTYGDLDYAYQTPWPYMDRTTISGNYGGRVVQSAGTVYSQGFNFGNFPYSASNISGSINLYSQYNNPAAPYRYQYRQNAINYNDVTSTNFDMRPVVNNLTASWHSVTASLESQRGSKTGGSAHLRIVFDDNLKTTYLGDPKGREILIGKKETEMPRGRLGLTLGQYGSIHSVNIKTKWQMLILDTQDSFTYRDKIKEGGLLYNQYANKRSKFIATEVVDAKGFKNLLWDYEYKKGDTSILPYMYATCYTGTTAGGTSLGTTNAYRYSSDRYNKGATLTPRGSNNPSYWSYGQSNDNFYIIYDFRTQVEFDTIGMVFSKDTYGFERDTNNQMNDITFQVCDDIGVANPDWQTVVGLFDDTRRSTYRGAIRYYTFPSGSVNKRYVKYKSRGGTSNALYYRHAFFGAYNFSGSLDNAPPSASCVDAYGGPTSSLCQVELANVKNFAVGDQIFFWSKQMNSTGHIATATDNSTWQNYTNVHNMTGYYDKSTPDEQALGGVNRYYDIIAINNNIVTLDRPITHEHIGVGTMAYKYNRGQVTLIGDRAAPFFIYTYSSDNVTQQLCNVTFKNGAIYNYNGTEYEGIRTYEDIGMFLNQESYVSHMKPGLYRNILTHNTLQATATANPSAPFQLLAFNVFMTYGSTTYLGFMYPRKQKSVINFCVAQHRVTGGVNVPIDQYGLGTSQATGKVYLQNTFMIGGYQRNHALTGGIRVDRGYNAISDLSNVIHTSNNIFPEEYNWNWRDNYLESAVNGPLIDYEMNTRNNFKNNTNNVFYYPSAANPRMRSSQLGYLDTWTGRGQSSLTTYPGQGTNPIFFKGSDSRRFGNRDYVLIKASNTAQVQIVKTDTFKTDGLYELYWRGDSLPNPDSGGATETARHIACHFEVLEDNTPVRIDFNFIYKTTLQAMFGDSAYSSYAQPQYNAYAQSQHEWIFENQTTNTILDVTRLNQLDLTTIATNKQYTLNKGTYTFSFYVKGQYYMPIGLICSFKDLNFKIVTPDVSKIHIQYSNMDFLKLFDNQKHYITSQNTPFTNSAGRNRVLQQTSDLTQIYKFNKIKL